MGISKNHWYCSTMSIIEDIKSALENAQNSGKSLNKVVTDAGADYASVHKWLHGKQASLNLNTVARILDYMGAKIYIPKWGCPTGKTESPIAKEEISQKVDSLESQLASMTKERDILKAQLELLKEIMQPMSITQNKAQKSDKKIA
mgnify:CR=1 FL=1